jgi:hypothetical protein
MFRSRRFDTEYATDKLNTTLHRISFTGENKPGNAMKIFLTVHFQDLRIWSIPHTKGASER